MPTQPTKTDAAQLIDAKRLIRDGHTKQNEMERMIEAQRARIAQLEGAGNTSATPAPWTYRAKQGRGPSSHVAYLLTSDFQLGERIEATDTNLVEYNAKVFVRRYRHLIRTAISLATEHVSKSWHIEGFVYARGGDTVSGSIHDELAQTNELTPIEACELAFEEEAGGIRNLAEQFGKVEVKTTGAGGNHDRDTLKFRFKAVGTHNYDRLVAYMLAREFSRDKRVTFQTSKGYDVVFPIYLDRILLTHGDRLGSRGGQGMVGPAATIMRGVQKIIIEQAAAKEFITRVDHGHFHFAMKSPVSLSNGTVAGYSELGKSGRSRPEPAQQWLVFHSATHGAVDFRPIILP